jgi:hypothetical protein
LLKRELRKTPSTGTVVAPNIINCIFLRKTPDIEVVVTEITILTHLALFQPCWVHLSLPVKPKLLDKMLKDSDNQNHFLIKLYVN